MQHRISREPTDMKKLSSKECVSSCITYNSVFNWFITAIILTCLFPDIHRQPTHVIRKHASNIFHLLIPTSKFLVAFENSTNEYVLLYHNQTKPYQLKLCHIKTIIMIRKIKDIFPNPNFQLSVKL